MPPSAITVCALPSSDLQTTPTFAPVAAGFDGGAQACSTCSNDQYVVGEPLEFRHLEDSPVMPDAHRTETDVNIGKRNPEKARPSPLLVPRVQPAHAIVELVPDRMIRDPVECSSDQVPKCMTAEYVSAKKNDIHDAERGFRFRFRIHPGKRMTSTRRRPESPRQCRRASENSDENSAESAERFVLRDKLLRGSLTAHAGGSAQNDL